MRYKIFMSRKAARYSRLISLYFSPFFLARVHSNAELLRALGVGFFG